MPDREQPDAHLSPLRIEKLDGVHCVALRVRNPSRDDCERVGAALRLQLPDSLRASVSGELESLWQAPGEWLFVSTNPLDRVLKAVPEALPGKTHHLADISHGRLVYRIAGADARDFLARGCSLDLHARNFPAGSCAQSLFAQIPALIHARTDEPEFRLFLDVSYQAYAAAWLARTENLFAAGQII
jgi:sarcosine oxidase subunit gamma